MLLKTNTLHTYKMPAGTIPRQAITDIIESIGKNYSYLTPVLQGKIGNWSEPENPWMQWTTEKYVWSGVEYSGNWTTRFSKLWKMVVGEKIEDTLLQELGSRLGQFQKDANWLFQVSPIFEWKPGDFGERDGKSCWWQSNYGHSRTGLAARNYGFAVLFYSSQEQYQEHGGKKGVGRAWMVGADDRAFVFNAYGIPLSKIAIALSEVNNVQYKKVGLSAESVYINAGNMNNEGLDGGSSGGLGYLLAKDLSSFTADSYTLPPFGTTNAHCHHCGGSTHPKKLFLKGSELYCEKCKEELFPTCAGCGADGKKGHKVWFGENYRHVCNHCISVGGYDRENHYCTEHGMCYRTTAKVWHTNIRACTSCQAEKNIQRCAICGRVEQGTKLIRYNGINIFPRSVCRPCRRKIAKSIFEGIENPVAEEATHD